MVFFTLKEQKESSDYEKASDSGISASWNSSSSFDIENETETETQLLLHKNSDHQLYTVEKVLYYEQTRKKDQEVSKR